MIISHSNITIHEIKLSLSPVQIMDMLSINGLMNSKTDWTVKELLKLKKNKNLLDLIDYLQENKLASSDNNIIRIPIL